MCVPGRDLLGEAFALIIAQLISREGIPARSEQSDALSISRIVSLDTQNVELICLCFVGGASAARVSYATRRLRRRMPKALIMLSLIGSSDELIAEYKSSAGLEAVQHTLVETRDEIVKMVNHFDATIRNPSVLPAPG